MTKKQHVMIQLEKIEKNFAGNQVIPSLNLSIIEGEFLTLLGPSGCGKTTLLRMIAGLEEPSEGHIFLDGQQVTHLPPYKRDVNMIFQHYALFPHMTVEQNILFGLRMKKVAAKDREKRISQVIALTQLEAYRQRKPRQLSGGQQQRVAIARALVNNPKVLLLDEPLGALDYQLRKALQIELKSLQKELGLTFVYVTHDQEEALTMSDRIVVMNQGQIEQTGTPHEIYHTPMSQFVAGFIGENNFIKHDDYHISLRPEKINLCEATFQGESSPPPIEDISRLTGKITDAVFYGTIDKVFIHLDTSGQTIMAYQYFDDKRRWKAGEKVGLWWNLKDEVRLNR